MDSDDLILSIVAFSTAVHASWMARTAFREQPAGVTFAFATFLFDVYRAGAIFAFLLSGCSFLLWWMGVCNARPPLYWGCFLLACLQFMQIRTQRKRGHQPVMVGGKWSRPEEVK